MSSAGSNARGTVVRYRAPGAAAERSHERASRDWVAARIAQIKGYDFGGDHAPEARYDGALYFVPDHTLVGLEAARALGISGESDLFGGVVPYPFIATKAITHPLVAADALAPEGWSDTFATRVRDAVFPGYSAFTEADARVAVKRVLERGSARVKLARGIGGMGQAVVRSMADFEALLADIDVQALARDGVIVEWNLDDVTTYSVGQVRVARLVASYCGTQRTTRNASGAQVYGGSDLLVVRGGYETLREMQLPPEARLAVDQARKYDEAASEEFPGFLASRRNYDVAQGRDGEGRRCSGVLEQSWRIGGASPAEIAALSVFRAEPETQAVRARTLEIYGEAQIPPKALVQFRGHDPHTGLITKYALVEPCEDAR